MTCEEEFVLIYPYSKGNLLKLTIDKLKYVFTCERVNIIQREIFKSINQSISTTAITFKMAAAVRRNCVRI